MSSEDNKIEVPPTEEKQQEEAKQASETTDVALGDAPLPPTAGVSVPPQPGVGATVDTSVVPDPSQPVVAVQPVVAPTEPTTVVNQDTVPAPATVAAAPEAPTDTAAAAESVPPGQTADAKPATEQPAPAEAAAAAETTAPPVGVPTAMAPNQAMPAVPPNPAGGNIVWRLQYVPMLQPTGGNGEPLPAPVPAGFSPSAVAVPQATAEDSTANAGEQKDKPVPKAEPGTTEQPAGAEQAPATIPPGAVPTALPQSAPGSVFPQFIVAPSNAQFITPSLGGAPMAGQPGHYVLAPSYPQARISNDPNNGIWNLTLEDSTDLPLPLEDEVDLSCYNYKIILGKDVVSGKGGKVQQLNRHFRNMVAAAYPTYDATSSKISKRKIGLKIYQTIIDRGGRFLDLEGKPMDRPKSILKVMKALKDAKTWTSDAKRLAKRKRDEQKSREVHQEAKKPRIEESPVALTAPVKQEDPVAVAAVVAAVAAVDDATKAAVDEDSDPKSRLEKRGQTLPTKRQGQNGESEQMDTEPTQVKGEAPQNEAAADSSKTDAPVESANATEGAGAAKDPEAVLQGLQLLTKAAANARDTTGSKAAQSSEIQNSASV